MFARPKQRKVGAIAVRLTTPENIRTLQRKLYQKAKQEPGYRFYALYDKVYRSDILAHAYRLVKAAGGCAGADGRTFEDIEGGEGIAKFLAELGEQVKSAHDCGMDGNGARLMMKNTGKPCAGKPHARFDEGRVVHSSRLLYPIHT